MGSRNRFGKPDPIKKPSRVTDNMAEFVTKGKLTEAEKRRQGRYRGGRKVTPRDTYGHMRPVTKSTGGKDSARRKRIETVQKYNKRAFGGVNPKVTSAGERKKLERRGAGTAKSRYSGGRRVSVTPGATPITKGDALKGKQYKSDPQGREKRSPLSTNRGATQRGKEFEVGPHAKVTTGKGKRYRSGYMTNKVRGVDPPKGPSRVFEKGPHKRRGNPEGETRVTDRRNIGSTRKGSKTGPGRYSSGTANATGARRTGGGKTPMTGAGQARSGGGKGGFKTKESKNFWSGETPKVRKARIEKLHNAMRQGKAWGKYMNPRAKSLIKAGASLAGGGKGRLAKALLRELGFASLEKLKATLDSRRAKRPVANLPSGYKESEKKAFKQTKKWNKVNRKKL